MRDKRVWLVLDVSNLAWRAFHTQGTLSYRGSPTGVIYGILRDVTSLMDLHATRHVAFCFDRGPYKREAAYTAYKEERRKKGEEMSEVEKQQYKEMKKQVHLLRTKYLRQLGFKNILSSPGYEADDIVASVVKNMPRKDEAVIVSTDKDFWQLLTDRVCYWDPRKKEVVTKDSFVEEWEFAPPDWAKLKALSGCKTDGVAGIKGIGDKSAAAFLRGNATDRVSDIINAHTALYLKNLKLVKLPYAGCPDFKVVDDAVRPKAWAALADKLGMKSIAGRVPGMVNGFGIRPRRLA